MSGRTQTRDAQDFTPRGRAITIGESELARFVTLGDCEAASYALEGGWRGARDGKCASGAHEGCGRATAQRRVAAIVVPATQCDRRPTARGLTGGVPPRSKLTLVVSLAPSFIAFPPSSIGYESC